MTNAFDANVPKRKPRTRLGGIIAEAEAQVREGRPKPVSPFDAAAPTPRHEPAAAFEPETRAPREEYARPEPAPSFGSRAEPAVHVPSRSEPAAQPAAPRSDPAAYAEHSDSVQEILRARRESRIPPQPAPPPRRTLETIAEDALRSGQERVAELRTRLERAALAGSRTIEPAAAAGRIRDTVTALRAQLQRTVQDRAELLEALRDTRRDFLQAQRELEALRAERDQSNAVAVQHRDVAEELLAESESLAQERDAALSRIQEFRSLDSEQATLLEQLSARLSERESQLGERERELAETREALYAVEGESELVQLRLDELQSDNRRLQDRVALLEAELGSVGNARDALIEIQRLVESLPST